MLKELNFGHSADFEDFDKHLFILVNTGIW